MQFLHQTKFGKENGNCFAACVASLFGRPIEDIPDFHEVRVQGNWWVAFENWLETYGLLPVMFDDPLPDGFPLDCYYIVGGISPRAPDMLHACIGYGGEIIHDPHPDGRGLKVITDYTFFIRTFKP